MPVFRLTVEYDGTDYHGWQRQAAAATIQGAIESAIHRISGVRATVVGAGRTDAGVHAAGQVAHFQTQASLTPDAWRRALNAVLPVDIKVIAVDAVSDSFHARFSAIRKRYQYRVYNRPTPSPLERRTAWHVPHPLNLTAMRRAAASLLGTHDFRAFEGADRAHRATRDTRCRLIRCSISKRGDLVRVDIESNRFLKYMVRNIVGTLLEIGRGHRAPSDAARILRSRDRRDAGITAPAHGLTLMAVYYPRRFLRN